MVMPDTLMRAGARAARFDRPVAGAMGLRLMASAPPSIDADVRENRFRADLYRRLAASRIDLPPLGDRAEDVPALAVRLLEELCAEQSLPARSFTPTALALLAALTWPG